MKRLVTLAALVFAPLACGQLKLTVFEKLKAQASNVTNINLPKELINMGASLLGGDKGDGAKVKDLVKGLNSVLIQSLEFDKEGAYSDADVKQIIAEMGGPGWTLTISSNEKHKSGNETSRIWVKSGGNGEFGGVRIMSAEPKELSIIEIIGKVNLSDLKDLGGLGIPDIPIGQSNRPAKKDDE